MILPELHKLFLEVVVVTNWELKPFQLRLVILLFKGAWYLDRNILSFVVTSSLVVLLLLVRRNIKCRFASDVVILRRSDVFAIVYGRLVRVVIDLDHLNRCHFNFVILWCLNAYIWSWLASHSKVIVFHTVVEPTFLCDFQELFVLNSYNIRKRWLRRWLIRTLFTLLWFSLH